MVVTILLALHDKLVAVPWQELDRMQRLHVLLVGLTIQFGYLVARLGIIADEAAVVLVAVQLKHIDYLVVRTPSDIGEVAVGRVASLQVDGLACGAVEDAYGYLVGSFPRHRILVWGRGCDATLCLRMIEVVYLRDVHLWIVGHHALVHAIEGELLAARTPEGSLRDAKLITVNALTIHNLTAAILGELEVVRLLLLGIRIAACASEDTYTEVATLQISVCSLLGVGLQEILALAKLHLAYEAVLLEVDGVYLAAVLHLDDALVGKRELCVVESSHLDVLGRSNPLVDFVEAEELGLLAVRLVDEVAGIDVLANELVAPPSSPTVLCHHVAIVVATEVEVFEGERLVALLCWHYPLCMDTAHRHHNQQC